MNNVIKKVVTGISTVALALSVFVAPATTQAASAGEVYKTTDGTVWFITSNMQRRPFTSAGAFMSYGFLSFSQVRDADASVTALPTGSFIAPQDGRIFCATETKGTDVAGECSLVTGSKKAAFTSAAVFTGQGYSFSRAFYGDSSFLEKTSNIDNASAQHRPGTLINNNGTVQLVVSGGLWGVPSLDVFNSWGWSFADVVPANSADTVLAQTGVIPARQAGQLVPTATTTTPSTPTTCSNENEGSLSAELRATPSLVDVGEGESNVEVVGFNVEAEDSVVTINRVDLTFEHGDNDANSDDPWDYFDEVSLLVDGDEVASMDIGDDDDFISVVTDGANSNVASVDEYKLRFSGLNIAVPEDGDVTLEVAVSAIDNADALDETFSVELSDDSIRGTDCAGISVYAGADGVGRTFEIVSEETGDLVVSNNTDWQDDIVSQVSEDDTTEGVTAFMFDVEAQDQDVTIEDITIDIDTVGADTDHVINTVHLYHGSTLVGSENVADAGATTDEITFADLDLEIDEDDEETFTVKVDVNELDGTVFVAGDTLEVSVDAGAVTGEDALGENVTSTGTATGGSLAFYSVTPQLSFEGATIVQTVDNPDQADGTITFEVTAEGDDIYFSKTESATTVAFDTAPVDATDPKTVTDSISVTGATSFNGTTWLLSEGQTATVTVSFHIADGADTVADKGFYSVKLSGFVWDDASGLGSTTTLSAGLENFKTSAIYLAE